METNNLLVDHRQPIPYTYRELRGIRQLKRGGYRAYVAHPITGNRHDCGFYPTVEKALQARDFFKEHL